MITDRPNVLLAAIMVTWNVPSSLNLYKYIWIWEFRCKLVTSQNNWAIKQKPVGASTGGYSYRGAWWSDYYSWSQKSSIFQLYNAHFADSSLSQMVNVPNSRILQVDNTASCPAPLVPGQRGFQSLSVIRKIKPKKPVGRAETQADVWPFVSLLWLRCCGAERGGA